MTSFSSLDPVFDFAIYVLQVCLIRHTYLELHILPPLEVGWRKGNSNALASIYTHWAIWENQIRS
jgi:hypothetical protein